MRLPAGRRDRLPSRPDRATSAGVPSAILRPKFRTWTRSEISITIRISCSIISTVMPSSSRISSTKRAMSSVSSWFMPDTISSSSSSFGSQASARPVRRAFAGRRTACRHGVADVLDLEEFDDLLDPLPRLDFLARVRPKKNGVGSALERRWVCRPVRMFSTTVPCLNSARFWNVRPIPSRANATARCVARSRAVEHDAAAARPQHAADHVEQRGLAGAVRADHAADFARRRRRG